MITNWNLEHFKSINNLTTLEFAPLTIFAGANSSGKSTIIQSILLTTQTLQSQVHSKPVVLNGHIIRLGAFNDIISNQSSSDTVLIGFELSLLLNRNTINASNNKKYRFLPNELLNSIEKINCQFSISASGDKDEIDMLQLQPKLNKCILETNGSDKENKFNEKIQISREKNIIEKKISNLNLDKEKNIVEILRLEFDVVQTQQNSKPRIRQLVRSPFKYEIISSIQRHFLPSKLVVAYDIIEEQARRVLDALYNPERVNYYEFNEKETSLLSEDFSEKILNLLHESINSISGTNDIVINNKTKAENLFIELKKDFTPLKMGKTYQNLPAQIKQEFFRKIEENRKELYKLLKAGKQPKFELAYAQLNRVTEESIEYIQNFFSTQVKYLGPLRDEPKPVYPLAGNVDSKDIGFKGENTAAVLEVHRNESILYIPSSMFSDINKGVSTENTTLLSAVLDWLKYLGVAENIKTEDKGKLGHELSVSSIGSNALHELTHVGVGVSQVLPILVQSLLSDIGSTLIFEQPELHLHPRVQTRLADFFISMIMIGKQCIIETHSEYLINRLRYLSAVAQNDTISKDTILYFVEKEKCSSQYRLIRINKYGVIENWPKGFFDENEENASTILRAGILKKQTEKSSKEIK